MSETLEVAGKVAGIGGLAIGAFIILGRETIRKNIFPMLTKKQAFQLLICLVTFSWTVALAGILAWSFKPDPLNEMLDSILKSTPIKIHPVINLSKTMESQLRLFPTDKVKIYAPSSSNLAEVKFGGEWMPFFPNQEYVVQGVPGTPVTPEFLGSGEVKLEVSILNDRDLKRDLRR